MADDATRNRSRGGSDPEHNPLTAQSDPSGPHQQLGSYGETSQFGPPRYGGSVPGYGSHGMGYGPQGMSGGGFGTFGVPRDLARDFRESSRAGRPGDFDQPYGTVGHGWEGSFGSEGDFDSLAEPSAERGGGTHRRIGPKNYRRSDEKISDDIHDQLTRGWGIDASEVTVEVKDGVVTLTGIVSERRMKHRIEDIVADTAHVSDINNLIRVQS